ncbi:hypothetical protein AVEN_206397-1 [Araneus ventricosus]|uniref:Uncharacterized protein n=1 Tax=Araneus ventricosus TaxID=182803 RepID=A0A4Y2ENI2_ARAVE|nr:hypothetical protein AVEN_206397-1 [Araneus ventricosus]
MRCRWISMRALASSVGDDLPPTKVMEYYTPFFYDNRVSVEVYLKLTKEMNNARDSRYCVNLPPIGVVCKFEGVTAQVSSSSSDRSSKLRNP